MQIADLIASLERFAPPRLAEPWDNVGLLVGRANAELAGPVVLTIDMTEAVLDEAERLGCGEGGVMIVYHPPIFQPLKRLRGDSGSQAGERAVYRAARSGMAVYSPHTALDACAGGVTDWLAEGLASGSRRGHDKSSSGTPGAIGGGDVRALSAARRPADAAEVKIVTFLPADAVENVRAGLASSGAGLIGEYELCSFETPGEGTFRGKSGTRPARGAAEQFERVSETRLEMVCSRRALALALQTLRQFHPYEEPAVDVYPLEPQPERATGAGRRITLDHGCLIDELAERLKLWIGAERVMVAIAHGHETKRVERIGVVPGAGGSLADAAAADGCEVFVTGEMKHHEVMALLGQGVSVILGGHTATERGYLPRLAERLKREVPSDVKVVVSKADREVRSVR